MAFIPDAPYLIGIDPGANTGVCLYRRSDKHFQVYTIKPWDILDLIDPWIVERGVDAFHCIMEDPRKNRPVWPRGVPKKSAAKIAQNVGSNKRDTDYLEYYLKGAGLSITLIRPKKSKWSEKKFKLLTGSDIRTNEHTRDAVRMVYGR